jgi:S1-C subfamily serine protease
MTDLTPNLAGDLNLPVDRGALIQSVQNGSPADKAGLRAGRTQLQDGATAGGDVIVGVDGKKVESADDVVREIGEKKPGDTVKIEYYRRDKKQSTDVKLTERPAELSSGSQQDQGGGDNGLPFNLP